MMDLETNLGLQAQNLSSQEKSVQTDKNDLRAAEVLFKAHKARENPTQAILDTLPKIIETIANSFEKSIDFRTPRREGQTTPVPKSTTGLERRGLSPTIAKDQKTSGPIETRNIRQFARTQRSMMPRVR